MKNLLYYLTSLFMFCCISSLAQPVVVMDRTYGTPLNETSSVVRQLPDGGFILAGSTDSQGAGGLDVYIIKTDEFGNMQWEKTYGFAEEDRLQWAMENKFQLTYDSNGNLDGFIMVGTTESYPGHGNGGLDVFVIRTDLNGNEMWNQIIGGPEDDYGRVILQDSNGDFVISGQTASYGVSGGIDIYAIKLLNNGAIDWQATYNLAGGENGYAIHEISGGYLISGNSWGTNGGPFLYKIQNNGDPDPNYGMYTAQTGTGTIYRSGGKYHRIATTNGIGYNIEDITNGYMVVGRINLNGEAFMAKLDLNGNFVAGWPKIIEGPGSNFAYAVKELPLPNSGYIVAGETNGMGAGNWDYWIFLTDSDGNVEWDTTFGGSGNEWATSLQLTKDNNGLYDGGFVVTGRNSSLGAGGTDYWLLKFLFIEDPAHITGNLFVDNGNCNFNNNETPLANQIIQAQADQSAYTTFTNFDGSYEFLVETETGNVPYTVSLAPNPGLIIHPSCPQNQIHTIPTPLTSGDIYGPYEFPIEEFDDDCLSSIGIISSPFGPANCPGLNTLTSPCPGFRHAYEVVICNGFGQNDINLSNSNSEITITLPEGMTYVENSIIMSCFDPDNNLQNFDNPTIGNDGNRETLTWDNNSMGGLLPPSQCYIIRFEVDVSNDAEEPFEISADFNAWCPGNSTYLSQADLSEISACSCDPNDKKALPKGCGPYGNIPIDQDISYVIRFENIGVGAAHDIVIRDFLDNDLDLSTFRLLRSSHNISNLQIENGNELVIRFNDIELPPAGKGEVLINIQPKPNLPEGTMIANEAEIYFDYNPPVITNTTLNTIRQVPSPSAEFTTTRECSLTSNMMDFIYTGGTEDGASFFWDFGPNATPSTSSEQDPEGIAFSEFGTQEVTLTVTRFGCEAFTTQSVNVNDISCGNNGNKVLICHIPNGNTSNAKTKCISPNAVPAHLAHGDICGPCDSNLRLAGSPQNDLLQLEITPNPFERSTIINFTLQEDQKVNVVIYDIHGKIVNVLVDELKEDGDHQIEWNAQDDSGKVVPGGIYYFKIQVETHVETRSIVRVH